MNCIFKNQISVSSGICIVGASGIRDTSGVVVDGVVVDGVVVDGVVVDGVVVDGVVVDGVVVDGVVVDGVVGVVAAGGCLGTDMPLWANIAFAISNLFKSLLAWASRYIDFNFNSILSS